MKKLLLIIVLLSVVSIEAQNKLRSSVSITQSYTISKIDSVKAILFEYKGDALFARKYLDLSKKLKKRFKKRFAVGFRYNLTANDKYSDEMDWIPEKTNSNINHDLLCKVIVYDLKLKTDKFSPNTFHIYKIDMELIDSKTGELAEFAQLEITSYSDVHNNNRAIVKLMDKIITK